MQRSSHMDHIQRNRLLNSPTQALHFRKSDDISSSFPFAPTLTVLQNKSFFFHSIRMIKENIPIYISLSLRTITDGEKSKRVSRILFTQIILRHFHKNIPLFRFISLSISDFNQ